MPFDNADGNLGRIKGCFELPTIHIGRLLENEIRIRLVLFDKRQCFKHHGKDASKFTLTASWEQQDERMAWPFTDRLLGF